MNSQVACEACGKSVARSFLSLHLERSTDPRCTALYDRLQHGADLNLDDESDEPSQSPGQLFDPSGDYYGNYADYQDDFCGSDNEAEKDEAMLSDTEDSVSDGSDEDSESDRDADWYEEDAEHLEILRPDAPQDNPQNESGIEPSEPTPSSATAEPAQLPHTPHRRHPTTSSSTAKGPFIVHYSSRLPEGTPPQPSSQPSVPEQYQKSECSEANPYHPFNTRLEWQFARWAKFRGPSSTAVSELLAIPEVVEKLELSFKNANELNRIIDNELPGRPSFKRRPIEIGGEVFEVYFRDINECIKALFSDPKFAPYLKCAPEKHYENASKTIRIYHDMHTGKWWWKVQSQLDKDVGPGRTVVPVIISSDKTQLTLFRGKTAYPLYLTIGNIPKEIRRKPSFRAYILIGYLPTSRLSHIKSVAARRRCLANLYHACLRRILKPMRSTGTNGVKLVNGLGVVHHCHPIYAAFIGDYPEQVLVTGVVSGDCPGCPTMRNELGLLPETIPDVRPLGTLLDWLDDLEGGGSYVEFAQKCKSHRLKPIAKPFWMGLPYAHVYRSITPDILHQLYQGVMKHMISWVTSVYGAAEVDARCRRLPPNHNIRVFVNGISSLSRVTGQEHASICQFLLALVIDAVPPGETAAAAAGQRARLLRCMRGLLDFLYLSQYPVHTTHTLGYMEEALKRFHADKDVLIELGVRDNFNIPKLHFTMHYVDLIKLFGTADNFNTEYTERLHIDLAKDAYRATNHKDEYPQMTTWLERREKVSRHQDYVEWRLAGSPRILRAAGVAPSLDLKRQLKMAKHPSARGVYIDDLIQKYGATHFRAAFARYVVLSNNPDISARNLEDQIRSVHLPFRKVSVWHRIKYVAQDPFTQCSKTVDSVHVRPSSGTANKNKPARFDTVLVNDGSGNERGVIGRRVGRVRTVFSIPEDSIPKLFDRGVDVPYHFAYVDWFTPFPRSPDPNHGLFKVSYSGLPDGSILSSIVPLGNIFRSVHLYPSFGSAAPVNWSSETVLDQCRTFFVNPFTDKHLFHCLFEASNSA